MKNSFSKKLITCCAIFMITCVCINAQTYNTVDTADEVYSILYSAELKGLCSTLKNTKPYTQKYINDRLDEIIQNAGENSIAGKIALRQKERFSKRQSGTDWRTLSFSALNNSEEIPITFTVGDSIDFSMYSGLYNNSDSNAFGFEAWNKFHFNGDFGKNISYSVLAFIGMVKLPLEQKNVGTIDSYDIGGWWYGDGPGQSAPASATGSGRTINTFRNNFYMPFNYKKFWDGSIFYFSNISNSGLEKWPFEISMGYGMYGEITMSFLDEHLNIGIGRYNREYASMDKNSSVALNAQARPFFGLDFNFKLFDWLAFDTTFGTLEFPNQDYINRDSAWPEKPDSYYFQNMFSVGMISLDWKYCHFDFGSSVIYPKRTEPGYSFPIIDRVVYQDNIGDYDNLSLFTDVKVKIPKYADFWFSFYLDESQYIKLAKETFEKTRNMFAYQAGVRANLPEKFLPYSTVSFRYTKIEPYCYTHQAINNTPWYDHYVSESYTNNGSCLGYYMPPNSDEFLLRLDTYPTDACNANFQFQMTRHGADYGSRQIPGSSLYSELPAGEYNNKRDEMHKYFLRDGAYEWTLGFFLGGSYDLKKHGTPISLSANIGFLHTWWTDTNRDVGEKGSLHKIDTKEYPSKTGVLMSFGIKLFEH